MTAEMRRGGATGTTLDQVTDPAAGGTRAPKVTKAGGKERGRINEKSTAG